MYQTILYEVANSLATITLNRPDKLNAFNAQMAVDLVDAFDRADADDDVRAVIVSGAGRAFCAGADLSEGISTFDYASRGGESAIRPDGGIEYSHAAVRDPGGMLTLRILRCLKPVIAAVNGPAVGVGVTMQLAMDIRIAAVGARFGFVFCRRGIVPESASSWFLPRIVGISNALEWTMSGRMLDAKEALAGGLVRSVHAREDLHPAARAIGLEIAGNTAPVSVALARQMMWRGLGMAHPMEAHRIDSRAIYSRGRMADAAEGISSFLEKRPPVFTNRVSTDMPDFFPWWEEPEYK